MARLRDAIAAGTLGRAAGRGAGRLGLTSRHGAVTRPSDVGRILRRPGRPPGAESETEQMHVLTILAADDDSGGGAAGLIQLGILLLIPLAMYFLMIRPQRRRMRDQQAMQSSLEVGDEVHDDVGHLRLHHRVRGRPHLDRDRRRRADPRQPRLRPGQGRHRRRRRPPATTKAIETTAESGDAADVRRRRRRATTRLATTNDPPPPVGVAARLRRHHVAPAAAQPGLRQHPGPRPRPAGRRVRRPGARRRAPAATTCSSSAT